MTGKIVSLSRARKTRARASARRDADENAAKHGLTKAERSAQKARADAARAALDAHERDPE
jgi:hypothetical protein